MKPNLITLRVWGDFACFTRPEMKVERRADAPGVSDKRMACGTAGKRLRKSHANPEG